MGKSDEIKQEVVHGAWADSLIGCSDFLSGVEERFSLFY
jgi:hypothetical protein